MRISWDKDMVLLINDNQKGSISWSQTLPERVAPGNELVDIPTSPGLRNHTGSCSWAQVWTEFPSLQVGQKQHRHRLNLSPSHSTEGIKAVRKSSKRCGGCVLWAGYFLIQWWQILAHIQKQILQMEESIEIIFKGQRVTTLEKSAALSLSEMKCCQVVLAYTKKQSCLLWKLNCNILICLSTPKYGLHLLVLICNGAFCNPNKISFYILHTVLMEC